MKGMSKGIGPNRLGAAKGVGKMMKKAPMKMQKTSDLSQMKAKSPMNIMEKDSAAKIMKKSPMEIGMKPKSPAKIAKGKKAVKEGAKKGVKEAAKEAVGGKMPMAKDPKTGKKVPAFAVDGKGKS